MLVKNFYTRERIEALPFDYTCSACESGSATILARCVCDALFCGAYSDRKRPTCFDAHALVCDEYRAQTTGIV